jgi:hypothetical protein
MEMTKILVQSPAKPTIKQPTVTNRPVKNRSELTLRTARAPVLLYRLHPADGTY